MALHDLVHLAPMAYGTGGLTGLRDVLEYTVTTAFLGLLAGWKLMDVRKDLLMKCRWLGVMVGPLLEIRVRPGLAEEPNLGPDPPGTEPRTG